MDPPPGGGDSYTTHDQIKGKVKLELRSETTLKSIVVKLEGISKTVVPIPEDRRPTAYDDPSQPPNSRREQKRYDRQQRHQQRRQERQEKNSKNMAIEEHKILYHLATVFPPREIAHKSTTGEFTLPAGSYAYDFSFVMPQNLECGRQSSSDNGIPKLTFSKTGIDTIKDPTRHATGPLPPSLSGVGDLASVKYFVKVTVNRASMFKMNARGHLPFVFLPMDAPVDKSQCATMFMRRQITVGVSTGSSRGGGSSGGGFLGLFKSNRVSDAMGRNAWPGKTISFVFEARFPTQLAFIPTKKLPLSFFVVFDRPTKEFLPTQVLYLKSLKILLYARTRATAHDWASESPLQLTLCDKPQVDLPIILSDAQPVQRRDGSTVWEVPIPPTLLEGVTIPTFVCPTFRSCNIERTYSIEVLAGLYAIPEISADHVSLVSDIYVNSGIAAQPPPPPPSSTKRPINAGKTSQPPLPTRPSKGYPSAADEKAQIQQHQQIHNLENQYQGSESAGSSSAAGPSDGLPSYDQIDHLQPSQAPPRRKFEQSSDYYVETND